MQRFDRGAGTASYEVAKDGVVMARLSGLVIPANGGALSSALLEAAAEEACCGVLVSVSSALVLLPALGPQHYGHVAPELRDIALAVVATPQQMAVYEGIGQAAACSGTMRRAFLSSEEARQWLVERARALSATRVWRPAYR
jgi:hypothetical protein